MEVDDIFGYDKLVAAEKANLQAGMNYREGKDYAIVLMSFRKGAPYRDSIDPVTGMLTYEVMTNRSGAGSSCSSLKSRNFQHRGTENPVPIFKVITEPTNQKLFKCRPEVSTLNRESYCVDP